ncbi:GumC family protein [Devosia sp. CN2-171]|uniref:GumC family protein n=1 Tax=Devosia sp. CN2-171 TaxID=3400909 RepID=UPI003BF8D2D1
MDSEADTLDLRSIFDLLRRRIWLIVLVTAMAVGAAGIALLALQPVYTATALVLVDPSKKNLLDPDAQITGSSSDALRVDSEVELVKSETTLLSVAQQLDLANDPEFGLSLGMRDMLLAFFRIAEPQLPTGQDALSSIIGNLREAVTVQRRGLTYLIAVSARSGRPEFAAAMANAVARTYIAQQLQAKIDSTLESAKTLKSRMADASQTVAQSERAFDDFVDTNIQAISEATGRTDFSQMRDEITSLNDFRTQSSSVAGAAEQSLARQDWDALASSLKDEAVSNLQRQRVALLDQIAGVTTGTQADVDLRTSLAEVENEMGAAATQAVSGLKADLARSQGRVTELRNQLRQQILTSDLPSEMLTSIYELQQSAEVARAQYQTLLTRQKDLDTQAYLQVADSRIVSEATAPAQPSFPNPRFILLLAGLVGLGLGVALAFLIENFVGGFSSEAQAEAILKAPVVSAIPRQRAAKRNGGEASVADSLILSPLSVFSEAIRRVRVGIDQSVRKRRSETPGTEGEGMVIVVSSAAPNEGKTTVSLALTRAYALAGMSTLLIDCDLRKPSVHKQLGIQASEGLLEYLAGDSGASELKSILTVDTGSGAQIVVGSRRSDVATDQLIAGKTFARLIAAAKKNFDVVVLDTPPVGPVVDGLYLAGMADAIAFVVKFSSTPQQEVKAAVAALANAKREDVAILTVLNQQTSNPAAYRGKYAGYYAEA